MAARIALLCCGQLSGSFTPGLRAEPGFLETIYKTTIYDLGTVFAEY
jgi:hypothetical protein